MKTLKFDTKSWHWYFAHEVGNYHPARHGENLCAYSRRVLLGAIKFAGAVAVVAALVAVVGYLFFNIAFGIIFSIIMHSWFFTDIGEAGMMVMGFFAAVGVAYGVWRLVVHAISRGVEAAKSATIEKKDSFAANAYDAWHNKFCAKLEFDYSDEEI